jgi:alpha-L-fucosidase
VKWVVHALCDIVSKNGNLLLNIPLRGDGSIDSDEEKFLDGLGAWMAINGEAIFSTRPWRTFGEGPPHAAGGMFNEDKQNFSGADIRFTQKNGALYAIVLGWPDGGQVQIASLADGAQHAQGTVERLELLGSTEPLVFQHGAGGLKVALPESRRGDIAYALKIDGRGLT